MPTKAERYDARAPGVAISDAQKEERQERHEFKRERVELRRTSRTRGIVIPDCAYTRSLEKRRQEEEPTS